MTVRVCNATFSDWVSLPFDDGWTDTFIIRVSALACLPPFVYEHPLKRIASYLARKRRSASIWVQVDAPGEWFVLEVRIALEGLSLPYAVTSAGKQPDWTDFDKPPWVGYRASERPPAVSEEPHGLSPDAILCLQALVRMKKGEADEIASLAGLQSDGMSLLLAGLEADGYIVRSEARFWQCKRKGMSLALRSWGIPPNFAFKRKEENNQWQIGSPHNHRSRRWPHWLRSAWPQAEIWTGWSEVGIPGLSVIPDGLAWGQIQGYETLFWLEVGDTHKSKRDIETNTVTRLQAALKLSRRTGMRLVFTQLSANWVHEAARWACVNLPEDVAVVFGDWMRFGELPIVEWGKICCTI